MKLLMYGLAMSFGILGSSAYAELTLTVDGEEYPLSTLMENCQNLSDEPVAQIACFSEVSRLLEEQSGEEPEVVVSVPDALAALRNVAQYDDTETGLAITGPECRIEILYYNNYFHISRRNVSSIDLFSATFDAAQLQFDKVSDVRGAQAPLSRGVMNPGATGTMRGGVAIESAQYNFAPKASRATIGEYAIEVADQLDANEGQEFDFVLVHPQKSQSSAEIWGAFETFVNACQR